MTPKMNVSIFLPLLDRKKEAAQFGNLTTITYNLTLKYET